MARKKGSHVDNCTIPKVQTVCGVLIENIFHNAIANMDQNAPPRTTETPKDQQPPHLVDTVSAIEAVFAAPLRPSPQDFIISGPSGLFLEVVYLDLLDLLTDYAAVCCLLLFV